MGLGLGLGLGLDTPSLSPDDVLGLSATLRVVAWLALCPGLPLGDFTFEQRIIQSTIRVGARIRVGLRVWSELGEGYILTLHLLRKPSIEISVGVRVRVTRAVTVTVTVTVTVMIMVLVVVHGYDDGDFF